MAGQATATNRTLFYRIGPSGFFLPSDLAADANTVDQQVDELDGQVEGNELIDQTTLDQWGLFHSEWKAFKADHFGGWFNNLTTALNDSNRDQLIQEETKLANFADVFAKAGAATIVGGTVQPSQGSGDTLGKQIADQTKDLPNPLPSATSIGVILVLVVVLVVVIGREF